MARTINYSNFEKIFVLITSFSLWILILLQWFNGWNFIDSVDSWFMLNPEKQLRDAISSWNGLRSLGFPSIDFHTLMHAMWHYGMFKLVELILNDKWKALVISQFLLLLLLNEICFIYTYRFFKTLYLTLYNNLHNELSPRFIITIFIFSLYYFINIFTLEFIFYRYTAWTLFWLCLPISLWFLTMFLINGKIKYIILAAFFLILTPFNGITSIAILPIAIITLIIFSIFLILANQNFIKSFKTYIAKALLFISIITIASSWSIIPQLLSVKSIEATATISGSNLEQLEFASKYTSILNIFLIRGYFLLYTSMYTFKHYPYTWIEIFHQPWYIILSLLYPVSLGLSLICVMRKRDRVLKRAFIFIYILLLILVLVMKGVHEPLSWLGYLLYNVNPVFFRHLHERFIFLYMYLYFVALVPLISEIVKRTTTDVNKKASKVKRIKYIKPITIIMIILIMIGIAFPIFNGDVIHPIDRINIIKCNYINTSNILKKILINFKSNGSQSSQSAILVFPFTVESNEYTYNICDNVHHPNAKSLDYYVLINDDSYKVLQFPFSSWENRFYEELYEYVITNRDVEFISSLCQYGIGYILFHKDVSIELIVKEENRKIIQLAPYFIRTLEQEGLISKLYENEYISLYRVKCPYMNYKPITVSDSIYLVYQNTRVPIFLHYLLERIYWIYVQDLSHVHLGELNHLSKLFSFYVNTLINNTITFSINETKRFDLLIIVSTMDLLSRNLTLELDNKTILADLYLQKANFTVFIVKNLTLIRGLHHLSVIPHYAYIILIEQSNSRTERAYSYLSSIREEQAEVIDYQRIDPTLWRTKIIAKKPFVLVFAETYDPLWEARVYRDGVLVERVRSIPVYGVINGFWINATGNLTVVIRYVPQDWFELGLKISAATFALCVFYLVWDWRRCRGDRWALIIERIFKKYLSKMMSYLRR